MRNNDTVSLVDLRLIITKILNNLEQEGYEEFNISHDYYWHIDSYQKYNPYKDPTDLTVGQLKDDLETLKSILNGEKEPLRSDLVGLSEVLRYLGENVSLPDNSPDVTVESIEVFRGTGGSGIGE